VVDVRQAIYDGPIDHRAFGYQPVILERLPSLGSGDAVVNVVTVGAGALVLNNDNQVVTLALGEWVRPAGCRSPDCAI
jgi:peptide/nickel transport system substrate-binding protein